MLVEPKRTEHFLAMALIGDGVMALLHPVRDAHAWRKGPKPWRDLMHALSERPALTRTIGVAQIAIGIWWALRQDTQNRRDLPPSDLPAEP